MQGVSLVPLLSDPSSSVRDYVFAEQNWHVMQAHQRMVRHGRFVYIRNAYPQLQAMCVEAAPKFPAGQELWEAHRRRKLNQHQRDIFTIPRPMEELYDVGADPYQLENLASSRSHGHRLGQLRSILDRWIAETKDSIPSEPTGDREDIDGNKYPGWKPGIQPGVEAGSMETNDPGPITVGQ
jgi:arylsulfatase